MSRARWIAAALVVALAALLAFVWKRSGRPAAPGTSLLLVTVDTLRADRLGAYGHPGGLTPALDALAARGLLFEEALSPVPLTLPSHSTILSGLEPPHHGVHDNGTYVFPREPPTLATLLKARGYATGAFVGAYVLDRRFGLARGFDLYDDHVERREEGGSLLESERRGGVVADAAVEWMLRREGPFFVWTHLYDPHAPYDPPAPFKEAQAGRPYEGEVAYADECVGRVITAAEQASKGSLLVAVLADHGESLGDHGELTHGYFVYQPTLRIPFLLAGAGVPRGERRPGPARTADLVPTVLARLGVDVPPGLDGVDLLATPAIRESYAETLYPSTFGWAPLRSFRRGALKLIEAPRPELYDVVADPGETRNLAGDRPQEAERLRQALLALRKTERTASAAASDPEVAERLRALGYVAAPPSPAADEGVLRDPKDAIGDYRAFEEATWAEVRGEGNAAVRGLRALVAREPGNPVFRRTLAAALRRAGRGREAVELLARLEESAPGDPVAWHERAVALAAAGRLDEARASEAKAVALNPLLPEPYNHLGVLEAGRGRFAEALRAFDAAIALDPNNARAWTNRANALRSLGRRGEATEAYRKATALAPRDPDAWNGLGALAVEAGHPEEAAGLFRQALALAPALAEARLNLAVAEAQMGRLAEARAAAREVVATAPDADLRARARALLGELGPEP